MGQIAVPSSGGGAKVVNLGSGTSFDVSGYSGYKSFTNDNFIVCAKAGSYSQAQNMGTQNTVQYITPSASCTINVSKSYDANTGILSASENVAISASCSMYRDGFFSKSTPNNNYTNPVQVYLVIGV